MLAIGVELGLEELGFAVRPVAYVEREAFACAILGDRGEQEALGCAPCFPSLAEFDGRPFRGVVDLIVAGLPCQPYSVAGKREGLTDRRSFGEGDGPIVHFLRIVEEVLPAVVFLENVPPWVTARDQWFRPVGERLSDLGYRIEKPLFLAARDVGASHKRERVFILAHRASGGLGELRHASGLEGRRQPDGDAAQLADAERSPAARDSKGENSLQHMKRTDGRTEHEPCRSTSELRDAELFAPGPADPRWGSIIAERPGLAPATQPGVRLLADGDSPAVDQSRRDQLRAVGNGAVPLCAALALVVLAREAGLIARAQFEDQVIEVAA